VGESARETALVTGASRGIGRAIAAALAARGWDVIGTCRDPKSLPKSQRVDGVRYIRLDLGREKSVDSLLKKVPAVDLLVNNAGESPIGPAEEHPVDRARDSFQVNFFGPMRLTQALVAGMRVRRRGMIVFIGSIRSEAPSPFSSIYSAAKAAVRSFAQSLRMEVAEYGVRVAVIAPWHIRTTLPQETLLRKGSPYADALRRVKANRDRSIAAAPGTHLVVDKVMAIIGSLNPPALTVVGRPIFSILLRHLPPGIVERFSARMVGLRSSPGRQD
jgi:short-subunit dehydrogenase